MVRGSRRAGASCRVCICATVVILAAAVALAAEPDYAVRRVLPESGEPSLHASNPAHGMTIEFTEDGPRLTSATPLARWSLALGCRRYGTGGRLADVLAPRLVPVGDDVRYERAGLVESYANRPAGLEQVLRIERAPLDAGVLETDVELAGLDVRAAGGAIDLAAGGNVVLQYRLHAASAADGRPLPARLAIIPASSGRPASLRVSVEATADAYPVEVALSIGDPKRIAPAPSDAVIATLAPEPARRGALGAPSNDQCGGAEAIPAAGPFPYLTSITPDVTDATTAGDPPRPSCQASVQRGIWYRFTPAETASYVISTCADAPTATTVDDTVLAIYTSSTSDCGGTFTQVSGACDDDGCTTRNLQSVIDGVTLDAGTTYFVLVWQWGGAGTPAPGSTAVQLRITKQTAPSNDTCGGAVPLALGTAADGTLRLAANDWSLSGTTCFQGSGESTSCTAAGRDVVYAFTAPAADSYSFRVQTVDPNGGGNVMLYTSPTCPAPGALTCAAPVVAANRNILSSSWQAADEIWCQPLAAGSTVYVIVDECSASTLGGRFTIEVNRCTPEAEPNDTPAMANALSGQCPLEGSINPAGDVDVVALGAPPADTRVFAIADTVAGNSTDADLRVTTDVDTLEYDDADNTIPWGSLGPNIEGRALTGLASYLRLSHFSASGTVEPYRLYTVLQPPGGDAYASSATAEVNDDTNNTLAGANAAGNMYFAGALSATGDFDAYRFCAAAGDVVTIGADLDPKRDLTPVNASVFLYDGTGTQLLGFDDSDAQSSNASGAGTLTATTPRSPAEALTWRARYTGVYYAGIMSSTSGTPVGDYLLSIGVHCVNGAQQRVDQRVTLGAPASAAAGALVTYTIPVSNAGPQVALDATLTDVLPAHTTFVSIAGGGTGGSWSCTTPAAGSTGTVRCTNPCFAAGASYTFELTVRVDECAAAFTLTNAVTLASKTTESAPVDNTASADTIISGPVTAPPAAPDGLTVTRTQLAWSAAANALSYDVVRGSVAALLAGGFASATDACAADDTTSTSIPDATVPAAGDAAWFLVRSGNCGGTSTYDDGTEAASRDAGIDASGHACP